MHRHLPLFLLPLLCACAATGPTSPPTSSLGPLGSVYRPYDLGTLGGEASYAYAVSADGRTVVGYNLTAEGHTRAFVHQGGAMTDLGTLGGLSSYARGVSADGGTVVGYSTDAAGRQRAFSYRGGVMRDLGTLGGETAMARAVSEDGSVVVGYSLDAAGRTRAFRLRDGVLEDLGTLGGSSSSAHAVSADGGTVVGESTDEDGYKRAFVYRDGSMRDLGTLPGDATSVAWGVSADGQTIVGESSPADGGGRVRAFLVQNGVMTPLGSLGSGHGVAFGVSGDGATAVGFSQNAAGKMRAFAAEGGVTRDLGTLAGLDLYTGYARNASADGGVVVGYSRTADKKMHATLWRAEARAAQTVAFTSSPPPSARVGERYAPTAAASSGLGVTFGASGACAAEGGAAGGAVGVSVRLTGVGTCTVTAQQAGSALFETASATQTFGVAAGPAAAARYVVDFERTPVGRLVYRVDRSSGLVYLGGGAGGPRTFSVPVVGKRRSGGGLLPAQRAVAARLWGSDRLTVAGPGTAPHAQGGRLELSFANAGPAGVTLTSLTLSNLSTPGATLTLSHAGGSVSRRALGTTSAGGSFTLTLSAGRVTKLAVFAPSAFAVDDVRFTDGAD